MTTVVIRAKLKDHSEEELEATGSLSNVQLFQSVSSDLDRLFRSASLSSVDVAEVFLSHEGHVATSEALFR